MAQSYKEKIESFIDIFATRLKMAAVLFSYYLTGSGLIRQKLLCKGAFTHPVYACVYRIALRFFITNLGWL